MSASKKPAKDSAGGNKKARSASESCPYENWVELDHGTEYVDDYGQFEPAANTPFLITFGDGSQAEGELDRKGVARFDGIPDGDVEVEYEPDIDEKLAQLKKDLREGLDEIVKAEREEYQRIEKELEEARVLGLEFPGSNSIAKAARYTGAGLQGVWNGVTGILDFVWEVIKGVPKVLYEVGLRVNPITAPQKFMEDLELLKATYKELQRFADEELEAYVILMSEAETYAIFQKFVEDYVSAQHSLEMTEAGGELVFDVAFTIITGGGGAAANARHAGKLKKLKSIADKLVDALKRKKRRRGTRKKDAPNRKLVTRVQLRRVPCFCPYRSKAFKKLSPDAKKKYLREYSKQLQRQQDAINNMKVDDYVAAREAYKTHGRNPLADQLQEEEREAFREKVKAGIMKDLRKKGVGPAEASKQAGARADAVMEDLAALHNPDMVAGGWNDPKPEGMGKSSVNSSIGGSWNQKGRLSEVDRQADGAIKAGRGQDKMNIKLELCTGRKYCP